MAKTGKVQHCRGAVRSKAQKLMAVCLSGVLLFSSGNTIAAESFEGLLRRNLSSGGNSNGAESVTPEIVATCPATSEGATAPVPATLTLSKSSLTATVKCLDASHTAVPATATNVCVASDADVNGASDSESCIIGSSGGGKPVTLQSLLEATHPISWTEKPASSDSQTGKERTLQLTETDLPRTDKTFFVGCQGSTTAANTSCKVTVNVSARPSSVDDKNVVTCAFGKNSNDKAVEVEMSQDKNALTIDCGKNGSMRPVDYTTHYCSPDDNSLDQCKKQTYTDILETFDSKWWTKTADGTQATLTIPKTDFPTEDQRLLLGCLPEAQKTDNPQEKEVNNDSVSATSPCRVVVTVKAARSASSASASPQVVATVSGVAFLVGLFSSSS
ncbi:SAG-related sequence SRS12A [Toxoplasma gondii VAND]|uniref:SAG-related sequence SRS12A n=1 Tax=Toxoplasma gondii VAND TaxID=933077 RepID=A0A086PYF1_TOXGO|nr:SAG-related sequence SRS12A [Toxoplasma gondii VAND]